MSDTNWNDVGDKIKDAVDSAISTGDFSNLSRSIGDVINDTIDNVKGSVKTAAQQNKKTYSANPYYKTIHTESAPDQPQPPALYNKRPGFHVQKLMYDALLDLRIKHRLAVVGKEVVGITELARHLCYCLLYQE